MKKLLLNLIILFSFLTIANINVTADNFQTELNEARTLQELSRGIINKYGSEEEVNLYESIEPRDIKVSDNKVMIRFDSSNLNFNLTDDESNIISSSIENFQLKKHNSNVFFIGLFLSLLIVVIVFLFALI